MTLVDIFSYIEVHVDEAPSEVCRETRSLVHSGISRVPVVCSSTIMSSLKIPSCDAGARCTSDPLTYKWKCLEDQNGDLSEDQLILLGGKVEFVWQTCRFGEPKALYNR